MEKNRVSLQVIAFNSILLFSATLILVIGAITLVNNFFSTMKAYKRETAHSMEYAVSLIDASYLENAYRKTREKYENIPEDLAADHHSEEYISYFVDLVDEDFWVARDILVLCKEKNQLSSIALFFPDEERQRAVFVIDGYDIEEAYVPGQWLSTEESDIDTPEKMERVASSDVILHVGHGELNGWNATNYIKIFDSKGDFIGYCTCDVNINDFFNRLIRSAIVYIIVFLVIVAFMAYRISRLLKKRIISPINALAVTAEEYTKRDKTAEEEETSFFKSLHIDTNDEIETLYSSLSEMESDINSTMKRIREMTAEKERVSAELSVATSIQADMLPKDYEFFSDRKEFDLYASMTPAKEVGGDFYDVFMPDDDHLCMVMGDVSGKGVPAALFMARSMTAIRMRAKSGGTPSEILNDANIVLCDGNDEMMFVTVWLAILTLSTGEVTEANAGHENPAVREPGSDFTYIKKNHGVALGVNYRIKQEDDTFTMRPGSTLFIYTDGVTEATDTEDERFYDDRLASALNEAKDKKPEEILAHVKERIDEFIKGAPQYDDLTMLAITYNGKK